MICYRCLLLVAALSVVGASGSRLVADPQPAAAPKPDAKKAEPERVVLTAPAAEQIRKFLKDEPTAKYLRISVADNQLKLDLDATTDPKEDLLSESRGVPVVVDRKSAALLPVGLVVDLADSGGRKVFRFASPWTAQGPPDTTVSLTDARRGFKTTLRPSKEKADKEPAAKPPEELFQRVKYDAAPGKLVAYLTPDPKDEKKHPAIVWITGGDCNSIDEGCWREGPAGNDQSACAYRKAGIVMMFPALRGGNDNPGAKEGFLGEVDDVLAAAAFLRKQPYVDPDRIYLGGHSTGGTMALLTAECSDRFRAVFSFGPTDDVLGYGFGFNPFSIADPKELLLRSPARWLHAIKSPTFVIEGAGGNASALRAMADANKNAKVQFFAVKGANHFDVLAPTNRLIAEKIVKDTGPACGLELTAAELNKPFAREQPEFVVAVTATADGRLLAWGGDSCNAALWDVRLGRVRATLEGHTKFVGCLAFSPDGKVLASGGDDETIRLWDTATGKAGLVLTGHTSTIRGLAFSPDNKVLASCSLDDTLRLWDVATGKQLRSVGDTNTDYALVFSPDGKVLASAGDKWRVWDVATGKLIRAGGGGEKSSVHVVAFSADGKRLATATFDNRARVWDVGTGKELLVLEGHTRPVYAIAFAPDGSVITTADPEGVVRVWDAATGKAKATFTEANASGVKFVGFTAGGKRFFTVTFDKTARMWDATTGKPIEE